LPTSLDHFIQRLIPTQLLYSLSDFIPEENSVYLYGTTDESRSSHIAAHVKARNVVAVELADEDPDKQERRNIKVTVPPNQDAQNTSPEQYTISLYSGRDQDRLWEFLSSELIYLDITGLPHHIWAALIASAKRKNQKLQVLYVEPAEYKRSEKLVDAYDLSESILGFRALPGFAPLQPTGDDVSYVPILGFEGKRFQFATEEVDPPPYKTYPIIGLPGFRPEYPFETYIANEKPLNDDDGHNLLNIRFADASCPFRLFYVLEDIAILNPDDLLKIALLGTKPHALGAVLYAIHNGPSKVQLVYDYPIRKAGRTSGVGHIHVYHITSFFLTLNNSA
jgi:hypothetical protein